MASSSQRRFVDWEERFVSHERGFRVVHYLLRDREGTPWLAVVGTERSLRHMVYVVRDEFLPIAGLDKSTTSGYKWRARREVVDWLSSLIIKSRFSDANHSAGSSRNALNSSTDVDSSYSHDADGIESGQEESRRHHYEVEARRQISGSSPSSDIEWVGAEWTCRKKLKHFQAFRRNGVVIHMRRFVYVMTEEKERHIAHVQDLYEDKKQRKKLRVRWFHKPSELGCKIPPPAPDRREVFYTSYEQDLSVECVDGVATVLTPEHYQQALLLSGGSNLMATTHMCSRQFDTDGIRPLNIEYLHGYAEQPVFGTLGINHMLLADAPDQQGNDSMDIDEDEGADVGKAVRRGPRTGPRGSRRRAGAPSTKNTRSQSTKGAAAGAGAPGSSPLLWASSAQRPSGDVAVRRSADAATASGSGSGDWKEPSSSGAAGCSEDAGFSFTIFHLPFAPTTPCAYHIGDHVEVLSQDSGVRGCWFRAAVVGLAHRRIKVRYTDLLDENNEATIEEWKSTTEVSNPFLPNFRARGRPTIRPCREDSEIRSHKLLMDTGVLVDAWISDGWWEGMMENIGGGYVNVYFPEERYRATVRESDLRPSWEWMHGRWSSVSLLLGCAPLDVKPSPKASNQTSNGSSILGSHANGSLESGSFDEEAGARILSMISKSTSCAVGRDSWNAPPRVGGPGNVEEDSQHACDHSRKLTTTGSASRPDAEDCTGVAMTKSGKVEELTHVLESVKEERQDSESSRDSSRRMAVDSGDEVKKVTSTGLKWRRKRHRQIPSLGNVVVHSLSADSKESLERSRDDSRVDRPAEDLRLLDNVEKYSRLKSGDMEEMPKFKQHRHGKIHGTPMGTSFLMTSIPIANLVMSR
ncbi:protein MpHAT12 [Marchantia polymorpha subsp. ruderalis]|nr:hypothetical protein MARPO_0073s0017 [Marchantia polymorpha]BBN12340.1 hypothetical protein Mp_5g19270 [Marchantia polymorpha subsp. ruderalis]|eukprot:PTQ35137.1 hypothetical protein MARPO_0073s0017 [Marchantia polymorpha]